PRSRSRYSSPAVAHARARPARAGAGIPVGRAAAAVGGVGQAARAAAQTRAALRAPAPGCPDRCRARLRPWLRAARWGDAHRAAEAAASSPSLRQISTQAGAVAAARLRLRAGLHWSGKVTLSRAAEVAHEDWLGVAAGPRAG